MKQLNIIITHAGALGHSPGLSLRAEVVSRRRGKQRGNLKNNERRKK